MNAARRAARAGRNVLIALVVGAVVIVAIVVAYVAGRSGTTAAAPPTLTPSVDASSQSSPPASSDAAPTGCLGGAARSNEMLLNAQKSAQHSTYGAVEVATAFYRWSYRYPTPSAADIKSVGAVFVPDRASESGASLRSDYAQNPNPSGGVIENDTPFYLSTATGLWTAQAGGGTDQLISVQAAFVVDGALSATKSTTEAFTMRWVDGAWRVVGVAKSDPTKIAAGGTAFTAGC